MRNTRKKLMMADNHLIYESKSKVLQSLDNVRQNLAAANVLVEVVKMTNLPDSLQVLLARFA